MLFYFAYLLFKDLFASLYWNIKYSNIIGIIVIILNSTSSGICYIYVFNLFNTGLNINILIIYTIDNDNILHSSCECNIFIFNKSKVTCIKPAIIRKRNFVDFRIIIVFRKHHFSTYLKTSNLTFIQKIIVIIYYSHFKSRIYFSTFNKCDLILKTLATWYNIFVKIILIKYLYTVISSITKSI